MLLSASRRRGCGFAPSRRRPLDIAGAPASDATRFAGCDVVEIIPGYVPGGLIATLPLASREVASLVALRRLGCETEAG